MAAIASVDEVQRVVHHVFLPPKLPQQADEESEILLINTAFEALSDLQTLLMPEQTPEPLGNVTSLLLNTKTVNALPGGTVDEVHLSKTLKSLPIEQTLAVNVSSQNAAVLITRRPDELVFEVFELSPTSGHVIQTEGRLIRTFPGLAVEVPAKLLDEPDFSKMITSTLSTMCHQQEPGMQPKSTKSGVLHDETRDTTDPAMVSELFFGVLRGIGSPTSVSSVSKNTRDEVFWKQAEAPWRRSPMWLLIRVSMQLVVMRSSAGSHALYKEIMVFIMSRILKSANRHGLPPDLIHCMAAKIDRRLQKLSRAGPRVLHECIMASIHSTLQQSLEYLSRTWNSCQRLDSRDPQLPTLSKLNFERDTRVKLPALEKHIEDIQGRQRDTISPRFTPSSLLSRHMPTSLPSLDDSHFDDQYAVANLIQFERWVADNLTAWLASNEHEYVCGRLHDLMVQYLRLARTHYDGNPEATSVMVLTMFELWVACDKAALRQCPLLSEYDPGIPTDALHNLILPFFDQMNTLHNLEDYIHTRQKLTIMTTDLLFSSACEGSFSIQYFDESENHQALLSRIERDAAADRQQKLTELRQKKDEYARLYNLYNEMGHQNIWKVIDPWLGLQEVHDPKCQACSYSRQMEAMEIEIHEWPLPDNPLQAKAVVFELDIPLWFANWRNARSILLQDLLRGETKKVRPSTTFLLSRNDPHLSRRHSGMNTNPRFDLLSQTKPAVCSHWKKKKITNQLQESEVCVPNGLNYHYYDTRNDEYPGNLTFSDAVPRNCTYMVQSQSLQQFLFRPVFAVDGPGPNTVIASQDACPQNMTIEEFRELGTLPLGHRIQWANIMVQLAMPNLDFKKAETTSFILQCIYQAGARLEETPSSGCSNNDRPAVLRSSHDFFNSKGNALSLLENLTKALQRVNGNWESSQAVFVFAAIAARALSLSTCTDVQKACLEFLSSARSIAMGWVNSLREKAFEADDHDEKSFFTAKSVELALICTSTFDIDDQHFEVVFAEESNASILVQSSMVVLEGERTLTSDQGSLLSILAMRRKRLLCRAWKTLARYPTELDDAIGNWWSAYIPGSNWQAASETADHWMTTDTLGMTVHYNLLTGELLVNGLPLDQPPREYRTHPQYKTFFGQAVVEIMPSTTPGFQFSTKRKFGGYSVQLGMADGELIVRATDGKTTYETIPSSLFRNAYPTSFVEEYVHWLNVATNTVLFSPVEAPWVSSSDRVWTLSRYETHWRLSRSQSDHVVCIGSLTSQAVSHVLDPLAGECQIHSILRPSREKRTLLVRLPKLRLNFSLAEGSESLESNDYRSMVVDADQSIGTLVGLQSKLVLKHSTTDDRMVLIPETAVVGYHQTSVHVSVAVPTESIGDSKVHDLRVDPQLGRLLDNGELGCKLFLAYLHALTSFCLPDPLTHQTGTEQALTILKSAAVHSFGQLSQEHVDMLVKIRNLTPSRHYYPHYLRVMQTVDWDSNISFLSQHGHFFAEVKTLLEKAAQSIILFPEVVLELPSMEVTDEGLLRRDNIRSSTFRVSGFGAEDHTVHSDQFYAARDNNFGSKRATNAFTMAVLTSRDGVGLSYPAPGAGSLWQTMLAVNKVHGSQKDVKWSDLNHTSILNENQGSEYVIQHMLALHRCLSTSTASQQYKFSITMWLSTLASQEDANLPMLQAVAMFLKSTAVAQISAPECDYFQPKAGYACSKDALSDAIKEFSLPITSCPEQHLERLRNEGEFEYNNRRNREWRRARNYQVASCVDALVAQWPCEAPTNPSLPSLSTYVNVHDAMQRVSSFFKKWYDNRLLRNFLESIEETMSSLDSEPVHMVALTMSAPALRPGVLGFVSENSVFSHPAPELPDDCPTLDHHPDYSTQDQGPREPRRLGFVIKGLEDRVGRSRYKSQYVADLRESLDALESQNCDGMSSFNVTADELSSYLKSCTDYVKEVYDMLEAALALSPSLAGIHSTYQRPRISQTFFLKQLSHDRRHRLSDDWKSCIDQYALALAAMQRAERLTKLTEKQDLINELRNPGHRDWKPEEHPESLLMEVESGFLIRPVQRQVAEQMQNPPHEDNAVMQLNMGEGKSSVIVPIVAAALADGKQLVRVVVAKPQSKQMAQMLISKLGGLLDRRVYYMPISRSLKLDTTAAHQISRMLHECMSSGGVLLIQPENILSFQLMALECYILGREEVGRELMSTLDFLEQNARDIVDESDENFNVRFELIYTMGTQRPIELFPDRWLVVQKVLGLVRLMAPRVAKAFPSSVDYQRGVKGCFSKFRILRQNAADLLNQLLADFELTAAEVDAVEKSLFWTDTTGPLLLLLRGIIACGVLEFLAVPYLAKDNPSLRSEFSHPDVVITLTSLSYYYGGLSNESLFTAMECLVGSDQADAEYQAWVGDANRLPDEFKQLQGINLQDRPLCISKLFPPLRFAKSVIDFFLAHIVFPKQMKEFPHKLSASGWDIGKRKGRPLTGFSGTNDSRWVLPTDVHHLDHPEQKHTNALVLEYMLQPENGVVLIEPAWPGTSDAEHLLATVLHLAPAAQVILDVGAQIIELINIKVAETWLKEHNLTKEAAVFVNEDDELCVIDRAGRVDLLRASSFFTRMDACLVFLDEAHTRGIDLRLPTKYRAAVTLGAGLTKDRLAQACMRMRKLGKGQSVVFCISREIQEKIMQSKKDAGPVLRSSSIKLIDVILWAISETHVDLHHNLPLWAVQGARFVRQQKLWEQVRHNGRTSLSKHHAEKFQEKEAQSLDDRFRPRQGEGQSLSLGDASDVDVQRIVERCQEFDELQCNSSTLQEEQERELSPEVEQERQVQRAPPAEPLLHSLHQDVQDFALRGVFRADSTAYMPAFEALKDCSAAKEYPVCQLTGSDRFLVTADFARTIVPTGHASFLSDVFQRPVQWVLTSREKGTATIDRMLIVSPYEANKLYKPMASSTAATLHLFKPRSNSGYASLDGLDFHTVTAQAGRSIVPRSLAVQLALFSGQLYISSFEDYKEICNFLGLSAKKVTQRMTDQGWKLSPEGFILSDDQGRAGGASGLTESPVGFFHTLMSKIRRNGDGIDKTDMGGLLVGRTFQESDFEEQND
ncbi:hypothetical protein KVR01_002324 [Diaporthe batatas]|uniref:uncharacterized protein n=1 Tax=Diaporthe batatas TaxID=748121 RepID=UPI001D0416D6|nr:uncharacterized protein KVR01_002324 [Diaporthe batatas]KAG8166635.1 hypothetical protein KVR01_002324 [Diaporthe batatas]